jgi:hypothetical protein
MIGDNNYHSKVKKIPPNIFLEQKEPFSITSLKEDGALFLNEGGRRGFMVVGFSTTYAISAFHHKGCEFEFHSWQGVLHTSLCDKVCQRLVAGLWFSQGIPVSSTNKTKILLNVALNTITL